MGTNLSGTALVGGLLAAMILVTACEQQDIQGLNSQSARTSETTGKIDVFQLRTGDCIEDPGSTSTKVKLVPCVDADFIVSQTFRVPDMFYSIFGFNYQASSHCPDAAMIMYPSEESWSEGDRTVQCLAVP